MQLANLEVSSNGQKVAAVSEARASTSDGFLDAIENYMRGHDVSMNLPVADAKITVSARNLANDELSLNLQLNNAVDNDASDIEARGKKGNIFKKGGFIVMCLNCNSHINMNSSIRQEASSTQAGHAHTGAHSAEGHHRHTHGHWHTEDQGIQCARARLLFVHCLGWFGHFPIVQKGKPNQLLKPHLYCLLGIRGLW